MCYDIQIHRRNALTRARLRGEMELAAELEKLLESTGVQPYFHVSGFAHPRIMVFVDPHHRLPEPMTWGLVPAWVKDRAQAKAMWNRTLNARGETIFEKNAFRASARSKRCLIPLDGFFEHHHLGGSTYPYFIFRKDRGAMMVGGLWEEWVDRATGEMMKTFAIVTTAANELMARIHNKIPEEDGRPIGPRMPLILPEDLEDAWLRPVKDDAGQDAIKELIKAFPADELEAYPVRRLRGKEAVGNVPEAGQEFVYPELQLSDPLA